MQMVSLARTLIVVIKTDMLPNGRQVPVVYWNHNRSQRTPPGESVVAKQRSRTRVTKTKSVEKLSVKLKRGKLD
jgi:hypothetical protein